MTRRSWLGLLCGLVCLPAEKVIGFTKRNKIRHLYWEEGKLAIIDRKGKEIHSVYVMNGKMCIVNINCGRDVLIIDSKEDLKDRLDESVLFLESRYPHKDIYIAHVGQKARPFVMF